MSRKQEIAKPYFNVKHDYDASLQAYINAVSMLHTTARTMITLCNTPEKAFKLLPDLKRCVEEFEKAAYGETETATT